MTANLKNSAVATGQEKVCFHFNPKERQCQRIFKLAHQTTTPFRYDLNQIPCDYTVEMRDRFKGLDLIECLINYGWRLVTLYRRQGSRPSSRKRNAKWLSDEALQISVKRREVESKRGKERYTHLNAEFQRTAKRDKINAKNEER